jgi:hypothetical protein
MVELPHPLAYQDHHIVPLQLGSMPAKVFPDQPLDTVTRDRMPHISLAYDHTQPGQAKTIGANYQHQLSPVAPACP